MRNVLNDSDVDGNSMIWMEASLKADRKGEDLFLCTECASFIKESKYNCDRFCCDDCYEEHMNK